MLTVLLTRGACPSACKDELAQNYLMDCIIQVFPDEFHIKTVETFVEGCGNLHQDTNVAQILCGLIKRLGNYMENEPEASSALFEEHQTFRLIGGAFCDA